MGLSVGIVGLPNVGKSTLFNALLKKQLAFAANFPFATIEPNIGVVPVPDRRLEFLAETIASQNSKSETQNPKQTLNSNQQFLNRDKWPPIVPATVEFLDIAGLIAGAHKGEGLGNKFLSHIRETDAICHVVRAFTDGNIIREGSTNPKEDLEIIETELVMADLQTIENQISKIKSQNDRPKFKSVVEKLYAGLQQGMPARDIALDDEEKKEAKQLSLLTSKPILVALNVDESDLVNAQKLEEKYAKEFGLQIDQVIAISAKVESEIATLTTEEQAEYLSGLRVEQSGLERLIKKAFATLGLITFLTAGEKEVRAWTVRCGATALTAAGVIHTDFEKNYIKADVVDFDKFVSHGGWKSCRENGHVRSEGREYVVRDGDVIEFKIGSGS